MRETALERQARIDREARARVTAEDARGTGWYLGASPETAAAVEYVSPSRRRVLAERARLGLRKGEWSESKPCGTYAAYCRHQRRGEEPCGPCLEAGREYSRVKSRRYRRRRYGHGTGG